MDRLEILVDGFEGRLLKSGLTPEAVQQAIAELAEGNQPLHAALGVPFENPTVDSNWAFNLKEAEQRLSDLADKYEGKRSDFPNWYKGYKGMPL